MALQPIPRVSVFQAVVDQLTSWLASEAVAPGERLPSERELCEQLQVSRASLREALRALHAAGRIESRGRAAYVKPRRGADRLNASALALSFAEAERLELHEFRGAIEAEIAALAAERADADDCQELQAALAAMERETHGRDPSAFYRGDHRFHRTLGEAARNRLLVAAQEQVYQRLPIHPEDVLSAPALQFATIFRRTVRAHRRILDAVLARDIVGARRAMRSHIAQTRQRVLVGALTQAGLTALPASEAPGADTHQAMVAAQGST